MSDNINLGSVDEIDENTKRMAIVCWSNDLDRVWPTLETTSHRMTGVLLTGVLMHTRLYSEARDLLESQGVPTFYNAIPQREDMKAQFGTSPTKLHGYDDVYKEITEIEEME